MKKNKLNIIKFILVILLTLIPIIKILVSAQFGITLMNDIKVIYFYISVYAILGIILIAIVNKFHFTIAIILYLCIYSSGVILASGIAFNNFREYKSSNNEHTLLVKVEASWGQSTEVHFYEKINSYFKRLIKIPKLDGNNPCNFGVFWDKNDNAIVSGTLIKQNKTKLQKSKDTLGEKCDFEILEDKIYLKLYY